MDKLYENSETGCCPRFDPAPWNEKEITWQDRLFLKDRVRSIFHIPLNFDKLMVRNMEKMSGTFMSKVFEGHYKDIFLLYYMPQMRRILWQELYSSTCEDIIFRITIDK